MKILRTNYRLIKDKYSDIIGKIRLPKPMTEEYFNELFKDRYYISEFMISKSFLSEIPEFVPIGMINESELERFENECNNNKIEFNDTLDFFKTFISTQSIMFELIEVDENINNTIKRTTDILYKIIKNN